MNIILGSFLGAAGLLTGWFIPAAAERLIEYKYIKKGQALSRDPRYTSVWLRLVCLAVNGALWAAAGAYAAGIAQAVLLAVILFDALMITIIDIRTHIVPNEAVLVLALAGLALRIIASGLPSVIPAIISMLTVMVVFTTLGSFLGAGTVGAGDVKLVGAIGLVLSWPYIMYGLVGMSALMLVWCGGGLIAKKMTLKSMLAFAPFMMGGAVFAILASITGL